MKKDRPILKLVKVTSYFKTFNLKVETPNEDLHTASLIHFTADVNSIDTPIINNKIAV